MLDILALPLSHYTVLNKITPTELEASIDFGLAKMKLLIRIYNLRISYPQMKIFLALADITACFRSRLKKNLTSTTSSSSAYNFSKVKQDHADLKLCRFYHLSQELLSMIWKIALTCKSPDLDTVLAFKLNGLGKLSG